jgi:hypothetical protein
VFFIAFFIAFDLLINCILKIALICRIRRCWIIARHVFDKTLVVYFS